MRIHNQPIVCLHSNQHVSSSTGGHAPAHAERPGQEAERAVGEGRRRRRPEHVRGRGGRGQRRGVVQHVGQSDQRADAEDAESAVRENERKGKYCTQTNYIYFH